MVGETIKNLELDLELGTLVESPLCHVLAALCGPLTHNPGLKFHHLHVERTFVLSFLGYFKEYKGLEALKDLHEL